MSPIEQEILTQFNMEWVKVDREMRKDLESLEGLQKWEEHKTTFKHIFEIGFARGIMEAVRIFENRREVS